MPLRCFRAATALKSAPPVCRLGLNHKLNHTVVIRNERARCLIHISKAIVSVHPGNLKLKVVLVGGSEDVFAVLHEASRPLPAAPAPGCNQTNAVAFTSVF